MEVGERIKARREQLNMTQDELAKKVGYTSRSSVAKVEANANGMVQSKLILFANALQTTPAYLLGWEEEPHTKNDAITDIILRLRSDNNFLTVVQNINSLTPEQLSAVETFLSAFSKTEDN
jgi:transcriptional regulator with XRE-family HTH domain